MRRTPSGMRLLVAVFAALAIATETPVRSIEPGTVVGPALGRSADTAESSARVEPEDKPVGDKTLVVWVALGRLDQRGGSALTLEDPRDRFDAIVFGELAPRKWMAGSDGFTRTQRDQSAAAEETEQAGALTQMAAVHQGRDITLFRDGREYAKHTIAGQPIEFGPRSVVVIGKRHRRAGEPCFLEGSVDDARVYDRALAPSELAALRPNAASGPNDRPWAWWTFDDGEAKERTGRFLLSQLSGGARIENGKLVLDGVDGTLIAKSGRPIAIVDETPSRPDPVPADWLTFHLAHPGPGQAMPGDPNCAFYWNGRYHLHYIYANQDGFVFAHVSSADMLHWKWHPTTLTPVRTEHGMFSGTGFLTKDGKPAIIYHGQGSGRNQIAIAEDDALERWSPPMALEPRIAPGQDASKIAHWDPDAWWDGTAYYALSGGSPGSGKPPTLFKSGDLRSWDYLGLFLTRDMPDVQPDEDISCPNFFRIGDTWMLLCISHNKGCRYYLGDWKDERFTPRFHARMNWRAWDCFAPESVLTPDGRRVMWAWCNLGTPQTGIQSLPRELSLPEDGVLRIRPLRELESLREDEAVSERIALKDGAAHRLDGLAGDAVELRFAVELAKASEFRLDVRCGHGGDGGIPVVIDRGNGTLSLGESRAPFALKDGEPLELRVFLDKNVIEVFANDRQAIVASHPMTLDHGHVRAIVRGGDAVIRELRSWRMRSTYATR